MLNKAPFSEEITAPPEWVIVAGRFQPFHIGHWHLLQTVAKDLRQNQTLVIGVISAEQELTTTSMAMIEGANAHHTPSSNPWPIGIRLRAVAKVSEMIMHSEPTLEAIYIPLPRPDLHWSTIEAWLPGPRLWIIPDVGDSFDNAKADFYAAQGDSVRRIVGERLASATSLRQDANLWEARVPEFVRNIYQSWSPSSS